MRDTVANALTHHQYLRERLQVAFPDADDETLRDTLEGMTNLTDSLAELLRSHLEDRSFAAALRSRMADMQVRCSRFEERARKKREFVCAIMERNLSTTLRHRRFLFTDSFLLLWKWRVG